VRSLRLIAILAFLIAFVFIPFAVENAQPIVAMSRPADRKKVNPVETLNRESDSSDKEKEPCDHPFTMRCHLVGNLYFPKYLARLFRS
jgi:hypothetical protein